MKTFLIIFTATICVLGVSAQEILPNYEYSPNEAHELFKKVFEQEMNIGFVEEDRTFEDVINYKNNIDKEDLEVFKMVAVEGHFKTQVKFLTNSETEIHNIQTTDGWLAQCLSDYREFREDGTEEFARKIIRSTEHALLDAVSGHLFLRYEILVKPRSE